MNPLKRLGAWGNHVLGWLPEEEAKVAGPAKPVPARDKVIPERGAFHGAGEAEPERYLFGIESPSIRNSRVDPLPCGVHATTKRIFLVRSSTRMQALVVGVWVGVFVLLFPALVAYIYLSMTQSIEAATAVGFPLVEGGLALLVISMVIQRHKDSSPMSIKELERREVYEIDKTEISGVQFKWSALGSRVTVHLKSGQSRSMLFSTRESFEDARVMFPEPAIKI